MRTAIRREIESIEPFDATEADHKADVLRWVDSGAELCRIEKPATPPKHLIAYFVVVDAEHVLLVDHINAGLWLPPGGHVEPGEHPRETVQRECLEELGIEARPLREQPVFLTVTTTVGRTAGHTDVSLWYVLHGERNRVLDFDESEFNGVRWFHRTGIPFERADPCMRRFLDKFFLR